MGNENDNNRRLNILHLEDSSPDAEIIRELLIDAGFFLHMDWASNEQEYSSYLQSGRYDLILADYHLPGFEAPAALLLAQNQCPGIPFICVSGAVGEEKVVELLKQGATDYVSKSNLDKLPLAMQRALDEVRERNERLLAEEALQKSEEQLRQSQKMEAIGQLAGGVAHDFNNILTVIMGYCNLLNMKSNLNGAEKDALEHINNAAEKAAQLTRGLLAFSRKQVMDPKPLNLNDVAQQVQKFLVRIIGEDIKLKAVYNDAILMVLADAGQIEQVLMNLAANARDAMPEGGELTIETGLQQIDDLFIEHHGWGKPGNYALISVSDNGCGMDEETRNRIFEPFFTTKEVGKGTGLGMAIVHGIVSQHNGFVYVYSELGKGSVFKIFLPLIDKEKISEVERREEKPPKGGTETILVVEDDPSVRKVVEDVLLNSGYEIITAEDGQQAVEIFSENRSRIKLILMDMVMPKKSGLEAYKEIRLLLTNIRVLFTSGYTADFIKSQGELGKEAELIMKPVKPHDLLRKVREMLDRDK